MSKKPFKKSLPSRPNPLSPMAIHEWVHEHIPARVVALKIASQGDRFRSSAEFHGFLINARWICQLLGIAKQGDGTALLKAWDYFSRDGVTTEEVKAVDLGGQNVDPSRLDATDRDTLITLIDRANKAAAHPTFGPSGHPDTPERQQAYHAETRRVTQQGSIILLRLLNENIGRQSNRIF